MLSIWSEVKKIYLNEYDFLLIFLCNIFILSCFIGPLFIGVALVYSDKFSVQFIYRIKFEKNK